MLKREQLEQRLGQIDRDLKALIMSYEKFFSGIEKREPYKERNALATLVRSLVGIHIPGSQSDIKFRLQRLTAKFNTYSAQWDRQLRLLEEGKLRRQVRPTASASKPKTSSSGGEFDSVYDAYQKASGGTPNRDKFNAMLEKQKEQLRAKYGDKKFEFSVATENGKPKIKVRTGK